VSINDDDDDDDDDGNRVRFTPRVAVVAVVAFINWSWAVDIVR